MKPFVYASLLHSLLGASSALAAVPLSSIKRVSNVATVPNKFIVEVDTLATIPNKRSYARVCVLHLLLVPQTHARATDPRRCL